MTRFMQVLTTVEHEKDAETIAGILLEKRLVACVQISSCSSMYHWQGAVENTKEFVLVMKTRADLLLILQDVLETIHPYDVPEILATEVVAGNRRYLDWFNSELLPETKGS